MAYRHPLFPTPAIYVVRRAMTEGRRGSSKFWRTVFVLIVAKRFLHKVLDSDVRTVAYERIRPGDTFVLRGVSSRKLPPS